MAIIISFSNHKGGTGKTTSVVNVACALRNTGKKVLAIDIDPQVKDRMSKKFDIIFYRNVMIYFDDVLKTKVLNLFHSCLEPGDFLIIGYYDMLPEGHRELYTLYDATTRIYRKK